MAIPLLLAGLSLLPKIPEMWNTVAGLFGKKVPQSVVEAGNLADDVINSLKKGEVPPEVQVQLEQEINRHKEKMAELALQEKEQKFETDRLMVQDLQSIRDLEKASYASTDKFVAQTRPKILRDMWKLCMIFCIYAPLCVIAGHSIGLSAVTLISFVDMIKWIGGFLFPTFAASYLGYTGARTIDKKNPDYKNGDGVLNKIINMTIKK